MLDSHNLKARLPLLNLLFLALILGGGGFFWHSSQQHQLYRLADQQLFHVATGIEQAIQKRPDFLSRPGDFCAKWTEFPPAEDSSIRLALVDTEGHLLCSNQPDSSAWAQQPVTEGLQTSEAGFRVLVRQLPTGVASLVVGKDLSAELKQQARTTTLLFLVALAALTFFSWLQRHSRNTQTTALQRLIRIMDKTGPDAQPSKFQTTAVDDRDTQLLADSYNHLIQKLADSLLRARQFSANVTHELRTPLTILRGETELALRSTKTIDQLRKVLESNLEEISRMSYLIEDLLLLSKSDLGEIPIKRELLFLPELIIELHHQAKLLAQDKSISVTLDCPMNQEIYLSADNLRLRQVFLNLLTNAIRYTPEAGTITIQVVPTKDTVAISVIDSGVGIANEHLNRIFDRFYRIDKTDNRNDGGSGLGLAIVKWIVEAHQGQISVSSTVGKGSCFCVTLPLEKDLPFSSVNE